MGHPTMQENDTAKLTPTINNQLIVSEEPPETNPL